MGTIRTDDPILTLEEYARLQEPDDVRSELVRGRLVREPRPGARHGWVQADLTRRLAVHARERGLGQVFTGVGVILSQDPPTVRGPDIAFVAAARLPDSIDDRFMETVPDLVVEIVSPSNRAREIQEKVVEYVESGARLVWVVDPGPPVVTVYRSLRDVEVLRENDVLEGGDLLPGLRIPVSDLFPE